MFDGMVAVEHCQGYAHWHTLQRDSRPHFRRGALRGCRVQIGRGSGDWMGRRLLCIARHLRPLHWYGRRSARLISADPMASSSALFSVAGASAYLGLTQISWPGIRSGRRNRPARTRPGLRHRGSLLTCHLGSVAAAAHCMRKPRIKASTVANDMKRRQARRKQIESSRSRTPPCSLMM